MINFVICDDKKEFLTEIGKTIDKVMMKNRISYEKTFFSEYNQKFIEKVVEKTIKVYILDIEVGNRSGIDMARIIRKNDLDSIIIFITTHSNEGFNVLKGDFMCLSFISKLDNYKLHLSRSVTKAIEIIGNKKSLKFSEKGILFSIAYSDILYINRSSLDRKCNVVTEKETYKSSAKFNEFTNKLDFPFIKVNKSCYVNMDRVERIDYKQKDIFFDNGFKERLFSSSYKGIINEHISK